MKLSYSSYDTYLNCPKKFKYQVDRVPPPAKDSRYFALYGITIESFFKDYVNKYIPNKVKLDDDKIKNILTNIWNRILDNNYVDWNDIWVKQGPEDIFLDVYDDVLANIKAFDFWDKCRSEVSFYIALRNSGDTLSCRTDFIRDIGKGEVEILDGKGTKHMDRPNPEQLLFYALLYYLKHRKLPSKLGFLFYKYQVIKYIDFNKDLLIQFKNKLALAKKAIKVDKKFKALPKLTKVCRYCIYRYICDEYKEKTEKNRKKIEEIELDYNGEATFFG